MKRVLILSLLTMLVVGCQCQQQKKNKTAEPIGVEVSDLKGKYAIVVGAYREGNLAERRVQDLKKKGYPASIVKYENGVLAVVICPSDNKEATLQKLEELRDTDVCPQDGWILTNE